MSLLNTVRFNKLRSLGYTGDTNKMVLAYMKASGATSNQLNEAIYQRSDVTSNKKQLNDIWYDFMGLAGHTQADRNARELAFWTAL